MQYTGVTYFQKHEVGSGIYSNSNAIEETLKSVYKRLFGFFTYQEVGNSSDFIVLAVTVIHVGNVRRCSHSRWRGIFFQES